VKPSVCAMQVVRVRHFANQLGAYPKSPTFAQAFW